MHVYVGFFYLSQKMLVFDNISWKSLILDERFEWTFCEETLACVTISFGLTWGTL